MSFVAEYRTTVKWVHIHYPCSPIPAQYVVGLYVAIAHSFWCGVRLWMSLTSLIYVWFPTLPPLENRHWLAFVLTTMCELNVLPSHLYASPHHILNMLPSGQYQLLSSTICFQSWSCRYEWMATPFIEVSDLSFRSYSCIVLSGFLELVVS